MTETKETDRKPEGSDGSGDEAKPAIEVRQDAFVVFNNEKDLRHHEAIRIKISLYTGIALRVKVIQPATMENLLYAIDLDSGVASKQKKTEEEAKGGKEDVKGKKDEAKVEKEPSAVILPPTTVKAGIINLRLEECRLTRRAAALLSDWLKSKSVIETIGLSKVTFDDILDFRKVTEGMKLNQKLTKISFQFMNLDEEIHGTSIGRILSDSRSIRELDVSNVVFDYKCFYDMCQAILNERCRLNILKLRGLIIGEIEGKIIQFIIMQNKQIHTLDLSHCRTEDPANFEFFLTKMDQFCNIRYLTLENLQPDISLNIEILGEALAENKRLEVLVLRDNKIKWVPYQNFWTAILPNRSLQKVNLRKTDLSDRVIEKIAKYLEQEGIQLADLDMSNNQITDIGLKQLSLSLTKNTSVKFINLSQNKLREEGFVDFVEMMKVNATLLEVSFGYNTISNDGLAQLSKFLNVNSTLRHLDLSHNSFNDSGFDIFAEALAHNNGLTFLDIAKNKEVTDEGSLVTLCHALTINKRLKTLDVTGLNIRKPFLKQSFDQALKRNITLQEVVDKKPSSIIQPELDLNIVIEKEIMPLYQRQVRPGKNTFNLALVEDNPNFHSFLDLKGQPPRLIKAAFKLIRNYDIRSIDFTEAGMQDDSMRMLSSYLRSDPNLRSIVLDNNLFTDEGLHRLTNELKKNTKLAHLSIRGCTNITNLGLQRLCDVISTTNTCLFQIDLDVEQFDKQLALTVITESGLNRAIQEKLRPVKIITTVGPNGEIIKVSRFDQKKQDAESSQSSDDETQVISGKEIAVQQVNELSRQESINSQSHTIPTDASSMQGKLFNALRDPSIGNIKQLQEDYKYITEVKFQENSKVGDCFDSALKAWRIYQPNAINAENQNLDDSHIQKLCEFLTDREMISSLNLRKNNISNQGAKYLSTLISQNDQTLTHLNITRNRIGQDGGQAILDALNSTTRIVDCQISYGNPISNKMGRILEREIKANIQAISYVSQHSSEQKAKKYELIDKGPDYMRCAIKMAQIHNILHLSLPDNMLALEDSRMIADLIKRNTPLRKLNLQMNQLDADCAALLANSLIYNQNLQLLDVSQNLLGDFGVYLLLTPLIRKQLQEQKIVSKVTPLLSEKVLIQGKDVKSSKRIFKQVTIQTQLQFLNVENNMTTWDAYRQVWLLLILDTKIMIKIEDPASMKTREAHSLFGNQKPAAIEAPPAQSSKLSMFTGHNSQKVAPETPEAADESKSQLIPHRASKGNEDDSVISYHDDQNQIIDTEAQLEQDEIALEKEKQRKIAEKKERAFLSKKKKIICCQKFCCFKDEDKQYDLQDKMPSFTQVMCWRFLRSRKVSTKFYTSSASLIAFEKSGCQPFVSVLISLNYMIIYAVVIVPFVMLALQKKVTSITVNGKEIHCEDQQALCDEEVLTERKDFNSMVLIVNIIVLVYCMLFEIILILISLKPSNTRCNSYLICQLFTGFTMKAVILISAQLIAVFFQQIDVICSILAIILICSLILSQARAVQIWLASMKADKNCILPRIKQNLRICMSTNYLAAATIYNKVQVEASAVAILQSKALEAERAALRSFSGFDDEGTKKRSRVDVKAKLAKNCKCCRWTSPKFYQLIMNDIPLLFCLPFAYIYGLLDLINCAVFILLTLIDLIYMVFYLTYDEELSIDSNMVYELSSTRLETNGANYVKLLNSISVENIEIENSFAEGFISANPVSPELMLTENQNQNNMGDTVNVDIGTADLQGTKEHADEVFQSNPIKRIKSSGVSASMTAENRGGRSRDHNEIL